MELAIENPVQRINPKTAHCSQCKAPENRCLSNSNASIPATSTRMLPPMGNNGMHTVAP